MLDHLLGRSSFSKRPTFPAFFPKPIFFTREQKTSAGLELKPHQTRAIHKALQKNNLLIVRSPGTGKTIIALEIAKNALKGSSKPGLFIVPAHLLEQIYEENLKWGNVLPIQIILSNTLPPLMPGNLYVISYNRFRTLAPELAKQEWAVVMADEAHRIKSDDTLTHSAMWKIRPKTSMFVGLTATPFNNTPEEFFNIMAIIKNDPELTKKLLPAIRYQGQSSFPLSTILPIFAEPYKTGAPVDVKNPWLLRKHLIDHIDFPAQSDYLYQTKIPKLKETYTPVKMTFPEVMAYRRKLIAHKIPIPYLWINAMPEEQLKHWFSRVKDLRQALIGSVEIPSSKTKELINRVKNVVDKDPNSRVLIFTNFVNYGANVISHHLKKNGISNIALTGELPISFRQQVVEDFKNGKIRTLVLSPVGFEGLNLDGTTHIFITDPHYNPAATIQLKGRATRANSPVDTVHVEHLYSTSPYIMTGTVDELAMKIANRKKRLGDSIEKVLQS